MARGRSGRRADYSWNGLCGALENIGEANQLVSIAIFAGAGTVMRTRGQVLVQFDGAADGNKKCVAAGLIIGTDAQVTAGPTAFSSPISNLDAEWLWHGFFPLMAQAATEVDAEGSKVMRLEVDSKAMRKVKQNEQMVLVVDGSNISGAPVADLAFGIRTLFAS